MWVDWCATTSILTLQYFNVNNNNNDRKMLGGVKVKLKHTKYSVLYTEKSVVCEEIRI